MEKKMKKTGDVFKYAILEIFVYANMSIAMLMSHYFNSQGFSPSQIGTLVAVYPTMSLMANPFWFYMKRKSGNSRFTLLLIFLGILSSIWFVYIGKGFLQKFLFYALTSFFFNGGVPISEAVVIPGMNYLEKDYGRIRLLGSVGFSIAAYILGYLVKIDFKYMFIFSNLFILVAIFDLFFLNEYEYHEVVVDTVKELKGSMLEFSFMLAFGSFAIFSTFSGNTFFTVLVEKLNLDPAVVGKQISLMGLSEIPFLIFSGKLIKRLSNTFLISISLFAVGIRWFLTSFARDEFFLLSIQLLQGLNYIVVYYSILTYIHNFLPKTFKDKAQALYWMMVTGIANIAGTLVGGIVIEKIGIINTYRNIGILAFLVGVVSLGVFKKVKEHNTT